MLFFIFNCKNFHCRLLYCCCCCCCSSCVVVIASDLNLYVLHIHVCMYVFLCTKNFQPKNKYAILSIIAQLSSVYVIITAFIYCSASVFCCIFSHSSSATTVTAAATAATTTAAAATTTTAKSRKTNFFVLFLFCYVSPLLSIRFVLFSTAVNCAALILFFCIYHCAPIEFLAF